MAALLRHPQPARQITVRASASRHCHCITSVRALQHLAALRCVGESKQHRLSRCTMVPQAANNKHSTSHEHSKIQVLFVCLGNICRSPAAEAMFSDVVHKAGLQDHFVIDSCGTGGGSPDWYREGGWSYHHGDNADQRMTAAAHKRGVYITSRSRPLQATDMATFDYIIAMDFANTNAIRTAADYWQSRGKDVPSDYRHKLFRMTSFCRHHTIDEVPDPYYGGRDGFEKVLDILEDACSGLLEHIVADKKLVLPVN